MVVPSKVISSLVLGEGDGVLRVSCVKGEGLVLARDRVLSSVGDVVIFVAVSRVMPGEGVGGEVAVFGILTVASSASRKAGGNVRPRFEARRRIPWQALGLK